MGRLTADPELRQTQNGVSSCRIRVAVRRSFKNQQTGEYESDFINCTAWRQTAEFISRYFHKGSMICVEGTLRTGSYQDKNHQDVTHYTTEVYVDNAEFTGSKSESGTGGGNGYSNNGGGYPDSSGYGSSFSAPPPPPQQSGGNANPAPNEGMSYGSSSNYEEVFGDGDVPF